MKKTSKSLDELFSAARQEKPVVSEIDARELLRSGEHMQIPFSLFSTKGIIMTSFGLAAAALIGYFFLTNPLQTDLKNTLSQKKQTAQLQTLLFSPNSESHQTGKSEIATGDSSYKIVPSISTPVK